MSSIDSGSASSLNGAPRLKAGWFLAGAIVLVVVLAVRLATVVAAKKAATVKIAIPTVSVTEAGVSTVPTTIEISGTISARYDMPISVEGDAGRVASLHVEAGDHVKQGALLARLDVAVLEPQVTNLDAALEQARGNRAPQVDRGDRRSQGQIRRGPISRGQGTARARGHPGAGRRYHLDPHRRGGSDRHAG
jgi:multidrug efflux pump subunit AcrA (membrane-fusion protein)